MITKEAIEALREAYSKYGQTGDLRATPPSFECAEAILTAAFADMPGPAVKVKPQCCMCGKLDLSTTDGDGGTECELTDGRWVCSWDCWAKAVDPEALTIVTNLASENERLRAALEKVVDWASRRCPADDESVPCPLCGARADIPGDFCKSVESIFPRDLLRDTRAALERT